MLIGTVASIAHGAGLPLLMLFFGNLTNLFIFEAVSSNVVQNLTATFNVTVDCDTVLPGGTTVQDIIDQAFNGTMCILGDTFLAEINNIVYIFIGIAAAVWIAAYAQIGFFQASAERQVQKIRLRYYKAILKQDVAWFDENPSGELSNRIAE